VNSQTHDLAAGQGAGTWVLCLNRRQIALRPPRTRCSIAGCSRQTLRAGGDHRDPGERNRVGVAAGPTTTDARLRHRIRSARSSSAEALLEVVLIYASRAGAPRLAWVRVSTTAVSLRAPNRLSHAIFPRARCSPATRRGCRSLVGGRAGHRPWAAVAISADRPAHSWDSAADNGPVAVVVTGLFGPGRAPGPLPPAPHPGIQGLLFRRHSSPPSDSDLILSAVLAARGGVLAALGVLHWRLPDRRVRPGTTLAVDGAAIADRGRRCRLLVPCFAAAAVPSSPSRGLGYPCWAVAALVGTGGDRLRELPPARVGAMMVCRLGDRHRGRGRRDLISPTYAGTRRRSLDPPGCIRAPPTLAARGPSPRPRSPMGPGGAISTRPGRERGCLMAQRRSDLDRGVAPLNTLQEGGPSAPAAGRRQVLELARAPRAAR